MKYTTQSPTKATMPIPHMRSVARKSASVIYTREKMATDKILLSDLGHFSKSTNVRKTSCRQHTNRPLLYAEEEGAGHCYPWWRDYLEGGGRRSMEG
ncbi:hypothetical protein AVEN_10412-1 [Araneus ventricosus]|uniref:Uncharacterized protein n=1 Tax=Araneus ventricosus TaxID=182803 RepID=A0A4Y2IY57_ARAVE|nr:hypothetical protein AVEN_10412-1 [Araneus ventricosus]